MKLTLIAVDRMGSVLQLLSPEIGKSVKKRYSIYGDAEHSMSDAHIPGFNSERPDPVTGTYHLGNGYRAYNPKLMRFNCPDSMSPFGAGGINPYVYCSGDPVNNSDPSGHLSQGEQAGIGVGGALGLLAIAGVVSYSISAYRSARAPVRHLVGQEQTLRSFRTETQGAQTSRAYLTGHENGRSDKRVPWGRTNKTISDIEKITDTEVYERYDGYWGWASTGDSESAGIYINAIGDDEWVFAMNFKNNAGGYFNSDVIIFQQETVRAITGIDNLTPISIRNENVCNKETLRRTANLSGDALDSEFFNNTPNGKRTKYVMEYYGFEADSVQRVGIGKRWDFIVNIKQ